MYVLYAAFLFWPSTYALGYIITINKNDTKLTKNKNIHLYILYYACKFRNKILFKLKNKKKQSMGPFRVFNGHI